MKTEALCHDLACDDVGMERPRFFPRQLITDDDLNLAVEHLRNRLRRHNRLMHGWGVVCGAKVCQVVKADGTGMEPWKVRVTPGYILGPYGDEILIDCERTVDLRTTGVSGVTGEPCVDVPDPWCSDVFARCDQTGPRYVAVKFKETMSRPVRVQPVGCGCDDTQCDYSRPRDGYEIGILNSRPESCGAIPPGKDELFEGVLPLCPPCPADPWVVLAVIEVDADGSIKAIDNCSCRRIVASFASFWWRCEGGLVEITSVDPSELVAGEQNVAIKIKGKNFHEGLKVDVGPGVTVADDVTIKDDTELDIKVSIDANVTPSQPRNLTVTNPDCSMAAYPITIKGTAAVAPASSATKKSAPAKETAGRKKKA